VSRHALLLLATLAVLTGIAVVAAAVLPERLRPWIDTFAEGELYAEVEIRGPLRIRLAFPPALVARDVHFVRRAQQAGRLRGRIDEFAVWVDWSRLLWRREARIARIVLTGADLESDLGPLALAAVFSRTETSAERAARGPRVRPVTLADIPDVELKRVSFDQVHPDGSRERFLVDRATLVGLEPVYFDLDSRLWGQRVHVQGALDLPEETALRVRDLEIEIGSSDLAGELRIELAGPRPRATGSLSSRRLALSDFWVEPEAADPAPDDATPLGERPVLDAPLPFASLEALDAEFELTVGRLELRESTVEDLQLRVTLSDGRLHATIGRARLWGGAVRGELLAYATAAPPGLAVDAVAEGLRLPAVLGPEAPDGEVDVSVDLAGSGATLREILAVSNGEIHLRLGPVEGLDERIGLLGRGPLGVVLSLAGLKGGGALTCSAMNAVVEDGVAAIDGLVDTPKVTARTHGTADLARLELDAVFKPKPKQPGVGAFKVPVRVSGPLNQLEVSTDKFSVLKETGKIVALGALMPPLIVVPLVDLGTRGNPCEAALASLEGELPEEQNRSLRGAFRRVREAMP
jgi:hypothetical protein